MAWENISQEGGGTARLLRPCCCIHFILSLASCIGLLRGGIRSDDSCSFPTAEQTRFPVKCGIDAFPHQPLLAISTGEPYLFYSGSSPTPTFRRCDTNKVESVPSGESRKTGWSDDQLLADREALSVPPSAARVR